MNSTPTPPPATDETPETDKNRWHVTVSKEYPTQVLHERDQNGEYVPYEIAEQIEAERNAALADLAKLTEERARYTAHFHNANHVCEAMRIERDTAQSDLARLHARVLIGEHSENCPFCKALGGTGGSQEVPQCPLCALEAEHATLTAVPARLREELVAAKRALFHGDHEGAILNSDLTESCQLAALATATTMNPTTDRFFDPTFDKVPTHPPVEPTTPAPAEGATPQTDGFFNRHAGEPTTQAAYRWAKGLEQALTTAQSALATVTQQRDLAVDLRAEVTRLEKINRLLVIGCNNETLSAYDEEVYRLTAELDSSLTRRRELYSQVVQLREERDGRVEPKGACWKLGECNYTHMWKEEQQLQAARARLTAAVRVLREALEAIAIGGRHQGFEHEEQVTSHLQEIAKSALAQTAPTT